MVTRPTMRQLRLVLADPRTAGAALVIATGSARTSRPARARRGRRTALEAIAPPTRPASSRIGLRPAAGDPGGDDGSRRRRRETFATW